MGAAQSSKKSPEPTPFQRFDALMRRIVKVPKAEIDRRAIEEKRQRQQKRSGGS